MTFLNSINSMALYSISESCRTFFIFSESLLPMNTFYSRLYVLSIFMSTRRKERFILKYSFKHKSLKLCSFIFLHQSYPSSYISFKFICLDSVENFVKFAMQIKKLNVSYFIFNSHHQLFRKSASSK